MGSPYQDVTTVGADVLLTSPIEAAGLHAWLGALPVAAAVLDADLRFVAVNARLAAINGRPVEDHLAERIEQVVPDIAASAVTAFQTVLRSGQGLRDLELRGETPAQPGAARVWREDVEPLRDPTDGQIIGLLVLVREVTEQLETTWALVAGERRSAALAELGRRLLSASSPEPTTRAIVEGARLVAGADRAALFDLGAEGLRFLDVDPYPAAVRAEVLHGVPEQSPVGFVARTQEPLFLSSLESILARFETIAHLAAASGDHAIAVLPLLADGALLGILHLGYDGPREFGQGLQDDMGVLAGLASAALLRVRANDAEARSRRLLEAVVQHIPLGVSITDAAGGAIVNNPSLAAIWHGEGLSTSIEEYGVWRGFHGDGRPYANAEWPLARSLERGEVVVDERIAIERFDGTRGVISISSAPVRDDDGTIIAGVAAVLDVTAEQTAQEARDAFIGVLSHELRTPITTIVAGASVLARSESLDPALVRTVAADVTLEATRLQRLVEDVLVLSRVDRGVDLRRRDPVLVHHLVRALVARESAQWPGLTIELVETERPPIASGDETYLAQVLHNLLANAAKYGRGQATIRLSGRDGGAAIEVQDDGPGIDPAERERVFELFYRSQRTASQAPGAGIGLFVCRQLVRAMGGSLEWRDDPPGGRFCIWLPAYGAPSDGDE